MKQTIEANPFTFLDRDGRHAYCRLRVFEGRHAPIIIASEVPSHGEQAVTDCWEQLGSAVWQLLMCPAAGILCVEHHHRSAPGGESDEFTLVTFTGSGRFEGPARRSLHALELELMLGGNHVDSGITPELRTNALSTLYEGPPM